MLSSIPPAVIVIVLVLVALGPIFSLFPSRRERQKSRLRQCAYREGYRVEFVPSSWAQTYRRQTLEQPGWILYWLPWPSNLAPNKQQQLSPVLHFRGEAEDVSHPLIEALPIPDPFNAMFSDSRRVGLVWRESDTVEALEPALRSFRKAVAAWCGG